MKVIDLHAPADADPTLSGDVLVCSANNTLSGIDIHAGKDRWAYTLTVKITYVATTGGRVFLFGNPLDFSTASQPTDVHGYTPTVALNGNDGDGGGLSGGGGGKAGTLSLIVLDAGTGQPCTEWDNVVDSKGTLSDPSVEDGVLIVRNEAGTISGYSTMDSKPSRQWHLDASCMISGQTGFTPGPAATGDGAVFFVINESLVGINVRSGQLRWQYPSDDGIKAPLPDGDKLHQVKAPMVGKGLVVVSGNKALYAVDWRSGKLVWSIAIDKGDAANSPVVSWLGNCIFVTTRAGKAYGHLLSTGQKFWDSDLNSLSKLKQISGQSGAFLRPAIDNDRVDLDHQSGHLTNKDRVFLPAESGAVFVLEVSTDQGHTGTDPQVKVSDVYASSTGLAHVPIAGNGNVIMTDPAGKVRFAPFSQSTVAYLDA